MVMTVMEIWIESRWKTRKGDKGMERRKEGWGSETKEEGRGREGISKDWLNRREDRRRMKVTKAWNWGKKERRACLGTTCRGEETRIETLSHSGNDGHRGEMIEDGFSCLIINRIHGVVTWDMHISSFWIDVLERSVPSGWIEILFT
jgi:hypothetical protein